MADSMASAPELQKNTRLMSPPHRATSSLGQESGQECAVHLHHVRQIEVDRLMERGLERGVAPSECIDAESREEVEIPVTLGVEEVGTLAAHVEAVEANRLEDPASSLFRCLSCSAKFSPCRARRSSATSIVILLLLES